MAHFIKFIHREWAGLFFFACLLIPSVILIYLIDSISGDTKLIQKNWLHFSRQHSAKTLSLNTLHKEIGYGGLIHQFKNQLLRGDVVKAAKIRAETEEAKRALMAYAQLGVNNEEKAALHSLRAMIDAYSSKFSEINTLRAQGLSIKEIDKRVRIDDGPAIHAFTILERQTRLIYEAKPREISATLAKASRFIRAIFWTLVGLTIAFLIASILVLLDRHRQEEIIKSGEERLKNQIVELRYSEDRLEAQAQELVAITENMHGVQEEMKFLANHDALTGLPSLRLLKDRLESAIAGNKRNDTQTALLFVDLDGFKVVNDSMGHEAGDVVLKNVAERLKSTIRDVDTAARIGGDEFVLVLPGAGERDDLAIIGQKIIDGISEPYTVNDKVARIGASIGIAVYPNDGDTADLLLRKADESMYVIKKSGKNNFGFCS